MAEEKYAAESLGELSNITAKSTIDFTKLFSVEHTLTLGLRAMLPYQVFTADEKNYFSLTYDKLVGEVGARLPEVAKIYEKREDIARVFGEIFKAKLEISKNYHGEFPAPNELGGRATIPYDIRYVATASATDPAYSSYNLNKWTISLTAGTKAYLLGDGTNFYKPSIATGKKAMHVIIALLEIGTTPSISQIELKGEIGTAHPLAIEPIADITIEKGTTAYLYELPGVMPVFYDYGVMFNVMPHTTASSDLRMLSITFYEYDYYKEAKWVA